MSDPISFRIDREFVEILDQRVKERGQKTRSDYVRTLLIDNLAGDPAKETRNRLAELQDEVRKMRLEILNSVSALLVSAGKCSSADAVEYVKTEIMQ
jgi:Arc/MetJ-type ribon-helix-helix transcriptional regulator